MTAQTGAGKSIMMRALGPLAGGRVSADWIRSGMETCTVEAVFVLRPEQPGAAPATGGVRFRR